MSTESRTMTSTAEPTGSPPADADDHAGVSGDHAQRIPVKLKVAPSLMDDGRFNAVSPPLNVLACWRMNDSRFDFASSVILPRARKELSYLRKLRQRHPGALASVFGHTDPTSEDLLNKRLSGRRARAVYALLVRDIQAWETLYRNPLSNDEWGLRSLQLMLSALRQNNGEPYYSGSVDGRKGSLTVAGVRQFQGDHGLSGDGDLGPETRARLFAEYMAYLCTDDESGEVLQLEASDFLAGGQDAGGKGDLQGCGEFNPLMVSSKAQAQEFQQWSKRAERNQAHSLSRRVLIFLFPAAQRIDPAHWPCPRVSEDTTACRKRFWSDAGQRRTPSETERRFDGDSNTFACRFYHRLAYNSPCEQPRTARRHLDVHLHVPTGVEAHTVALRLSSTDGSYDRVLDAQEGFFSADASLLTLRFTGVLPGRKYNLYQLESSEVSVPIFEGVPFDAIPSHGTEASGQPIEIESLSDTSHLDYDLEKEFS